MLQATKHPHSSIFVLFLTLALAACDGTDPEPPVFGVTGSWNGFVFPSGQTCVISQQLTEDAQGNVNGTGQLGAACALGNYQISGWRNAGGVADSIDFQWTGPQMFTQSGFYNGVDSLTGHSIGFGCSGTLCPFRYGRASQ